MDYKSFLFSALVYLVSAVVSVPIAKRLGLGSVLGYLIAGVLIGPFVLHIISNLNEEVMHFSEFGIIMLLFLIGLELRPSMLWQLRLNIFGMGTLQIILTTAAISIMAMLLGLSWQYALAIGLIFSLSSTAVVLQIFTEKGWLKTAAGNAAFSVLLFQDLAVIPILSILPLLAMPGTVIAPLNGHSLIAGLSAWQKTIIIILSVSAIVLFGHYLIKPILRFIARTKLHEIFTAAALLIVIAITFLMERLGLSPAMGAFIAGVVLAESEYRHELKANIQPFKGLLLGLFFISVGISINFNTIVQHIMLIAELILLLLLLKFLMCFIIGKFFKIGARDNLLFALSLTQGGEFCFVLLAYALKNHVLPSNITDILVAVVALSMITTPLLLLIYEKFLVKIFIKQQMTKPYDDLSQEENSVIIAGFGRFGQIVGRLLLANGIKTTVLDLDPDHIELVKRFGYKVYYGDASQHELLHAAKLEQAKLLIIAIDDDRKALQIAEEAHKEFPKLKILARVRGRTQAFEFLRKGFKDVYRETFDSSLRMGIDALRLLGFTPEQAARAGNIFKEHDEQTMLKTASIYHDEKLFISEANKSRENLEKTFAQDIQSKKSINSN